MTYMINLRVKSANIGWFYSSLKSIYDNSNIFKLILSFQHFCLKEHILKFILLQNINLFYASKTN